MVIEQFKMSEEANWDSFCEKSWQGTFLHTRQFLSYHGDKFVDKSLIIKDNDNWIGVFPAAIDNQDSHCIVSHPGITYGGILHSGKLMGSSMLLAMNEIIKHYVEEGFSKLIYKVVPWFYHKIPTQDDLYALFRLNAKRIKVDLSATINLNNRGVVSERRRRGKKKSDREGLEISVGNDYLEEYWNVVEYNLRTKYNKKPTHSFNEIFILSDRFPDNILLIVGRLRGSVVAGVLLFRTKFADHAQYIAANDIGYKISALDKIFEYCISKSKEDGKIWFDFGISTEDNGLLLNDSLFQFKREFGAGSTTYETYQIDLKNICVK